MRALITGAGGFLGGCLAAALSREGHDVRAMVRRAAVPDGLRIPRIEVVQGDLADGESLRRAVAGMDAVFHAASTQRGPREEFAAAVRGTDLLLDLSFREGVRRFVQISSIVIYDMLSGRTGVIDEDSPWEPQPGRAGPYAHSKIDAERQAFAWHRKGLPVVIVRPGILYGPGGRAIHPSIGHPLTKRLFLLVDGHRELLSLAYIDNAVDGILRAASCERAVGRPYNLVDGVSITRKEYMRRRNAAAASPLSLLPVPLALLLAAVAAAAPFRRFGLAGHVSTLYGLRRAFRSVRIDAGRARRELGWQPRVGLEEGLSRTFGPRAAAP